MNKSIKDNIAKSLMTEFVNRKIEQLLSEQALPPDPNALPPDPNAMPADPMGGMPMDPNAMPPDPNDPNAMPPEEEMPPEEGEGDEEPIPEDATTGVVEKIKEEMETNEKPTSELVKVAKGYLQDFGLLDKNKKYQALAVIEKLREEEIPDLNKVADYLEKFLLGI